MKSLLILAAGIVSVLLFGACGSDSVPVPRRVAYPRLVLPDSLYRPVNVNGVELSLNAAADTSTVAGRDGWLTVSYPDGIAQLFITVTITNGGDEFERVIDNRVERLSLNTGGSSSVVSSFVTPRAIDARIIVTPASNPTPVQFLVHDGGRMVVSGTAAVRDAATAPADSLRPVIDMLERDINRLIMNL